MLSGITDKQKEMTAPTAKVRSFLLDRSLG
nr:MAG TPA: hypothetical protein [Caudoviricetes sp.]